MKRFIILSIFIASMMAALACGPSARPRYYVFSVFPTTQWQQVGYTEMVKYWTDYTGKADVEMDVEYLSLVDLDKFEASDNALVKAALKKGDNETVKYLKRLIAYLKISDRMNPNAWQYPSKEDMEEMKKELRNIRNSARVGKIKGKYQAQYALLEMRCNMALDQTELNKKVWTSSTYKLPESPYRNMAKGLYAHALVKEGKIHDAIKIYSSLGDIASIKWLVRKKRNLKGIEEEYAADPNSATLHFLVQDFVNNAQETKDNAHNLEMMQYVEATTLYDDEIRRFIAFAKQVVAEGKTQSPAMWQAAAGYLTSMLGNDAEASSMLLEAMNMAGTGRMKDNARVCRMAVESKKAENNSDYHNYIYTELKWLANKSMAAKASGDMHYNQMVERFVYENLAPGYMKNGNASLATNLIALADKQCAYFDHTRSLIDNRGEFWTQIDELTAAEMQEYKRYMQAGNHGSTLEQMLVEVVGKSISESDYNDLIGTKLMREGKFEPAIPYLKQVPLSYISKQAISPYMAQRSFRKEYWMGRQPLKGDAYTPVQVRSNQKLEFCEAVVALENSPRSEANDYRLATLLYQASYKGDCWYLTRYGVSVYDSVRYRDEALLISQTIDLLKAPAASKDFRTKEKALYALASIPQGEELFTGEYVGKDYTYVKRVNKNTPQYTAFENLLAFYQANPAKTSAFVKKCDVLKQFRTLTQPKKKTAAKRRKR
ncbi:MAG: hypothetical protein Q4B68_07610 [Bacteroidales bacterium]|nr:hypothetical protein [Bacteroidales bacterium]